MNATVNQRCANQACTCAAPPGEAYCSDACRKRVETPLSDQARDCPCGHVSCMPTTTDIHKNG